MSLPVAARGDPDRLWGVATSFGLHLVTFLLLVYLIPASPLREPIEEIVTVAIVPPAPPPAETIRAPGRSNAAPVLAVPERNDEEGPPVEPNEPTAEPVSAGGMIQPAVMLSAGVLSTPEAEQARLALPTLVDYDRRLQLCGLEAMEQIQAWQDSYRPDRLVSYAMQDARLRGDRVIADGAAFRSGGRWYNLRFECEVTPDIGKVVSFRFSVGEPIPYAEWAGHNLPSEY